MLDELRRRALTRAVAVEAEGVPADGRGTVVVANHPGELDADVLRLVWPTPLATAFRGAALRRGTSVLVLPEGRPSRDGTLGTFREEAFAEVVAAVAAGVSVTVTPAAVVGTHGLDRALPWGSGPATPARVSVHVGAPFAPRGLDVVTLARRTHEAIADLLAVHHAV